MESRTKKDPDRRFSDQVKVCGTAPSSYDSQMLLVLWLYGDCTSSCLSFGSHPSLVLVSWNAFPHEIMSAQPGAEGLTPCLNAKLEAVSPPREPTGYGVTFPRYRRVALNIRLVAGFVARKREYPRHLHPLEDWKWQKGETRPRVITLPLLYTYPVMVHTNSMVLG